MIGIDNYEQEMKVLRVLYYYLIIWLNHFFSPVGEAGEYVVGWQGRLVLL